MPSGAKKRKAAKKKKDLANSASAVDVHSHGRQNLKHDDDREGESEIISINIEHVEPGREDPERGLRRSSSSSSSGSSSGDRAEEKSAADKTNIVVDKALAVDSGKESDLFTDDKQVTESSLAEACNSIVKTVHISDLDKAALSEDRVPVTTSVSNTDNVTTSRNVELVVKENVEEKLAVVDEKVTVTEVLVELEKRIDEASATLHDSALTTSDSKASQVTENEDKLELSYNASMVDASVRADNVKDTPTRVGHGHQKESKDLVEWTSNIWRHL